MTRKQRRLTMIAAFGSVLAVAAGLVFYGLGESFLYFRSPTDVIEKAIPVGQRFRLGGLVGEGSLVRDGSTTAQFTVTDTANTLSVRYSGVLPDLFREGQGVVAEGRIGSDGVFVADTVLAKHDETYMPPEVAEALKRQGQWKGAGAGAGATN
ncbi:MAG: cytochrome c maturation protein CcmE [Rhizobiales bacterium]|nr:cytochrome c maturation protein CcmE [Hyphomicrobiales bacterium]